MHVALLRIPRSSDDGNCPWGLDIPYSVAFLHACTVTKRGMRIIARRPHSPPPTAEVYAYRGEVDRAFEWLERAYGQRDSGLSQIKGDPHFQWLERDPRYTALLEKMRLPL